MCVYVLAASVLRQILWPMSVGQSAGWYVLFNIALDLVSDLPMFRDHNT